MSIYGLISGALAALGIVGTILLPAGNPLHESLWVGYLIMLGRAIGDPRRREAYRDDVQAAWIVSARAFLVGLGIAAVAGLDLCRGVGGVSGADALQLHRDFHQRDAGGEARGGP